MWQDMKMYWAWRGDGKKILPVPTQKRLDYATLFRGTEIKMKLCIGVWDDEVYTPLHRDELARLRGRTWGLIHFLIEWFRGGKRKPGRNLAT
jgi:hypothetical protein